MAAVFNTRAPAARTYPRPQDESWKAQGFINFTINYPDGRKAKLGAISLKDSRTFDRNMRAWLAANPEANAAKLLASLTIDYRSADEEGPAPDFDALGSAAPATQKS